MVHCVGLGGGGALAASCVLDPANVLSQLGPTRALEGSAFDAWSGLQGFWRALRY
jgi:hypothetical protein